MKRQTFNVDALFDGKWWCLQAREAPGALSQVKRLADAEEWIQESISMVTELPEYSFDVVIHPRVLGPLDEEIIEAKKFAAELEEQQSKVAQKSRAVARTLKDAGVNGVEIARLLGVSQQRISQLLKASPKS